MAIGAYQIAQPSVSLQDQLIRGRGRQDVGAEVVAKKRSLKEDLLEQMKRRQKSAKKRAGSFLGVKGLGDALTTGLDFAAGFVDPATAAMLGAVSGGIGGYGQMRAADKLKGATKGFEQYGFLSPQVQDIKSQIRGQEKGIGDVLISAGTQALQNFAMGKAGEAMSGTKKLKGLDPAKRSLPGLETGKQFGIKVPESGFDMTKFKGQAVQPGMKVPEGFDMSKLQAPNQRARFKVLERAGGSPNLKYDPEAIELMKQYSPEADVIKGKGGKKGYQGAKKAKWLEGGFDFSDMEQDEIMSTLSTMTSMFSPMLQGLTEQGGQYPQIDFSSLY